MCTDPDASESKKGMRHEKGENKRAGNVLYAGRGG